MTRDELYEKLRTVTPDNYHPGSFKRDVFEALEIEDNPKKDELFRIAWNFGHGNGYHEVWSYLDEMVSLIK